MAITRVVGGVSLPASKWLTAITTLINDIRFRRNLTTTETMNKVIESAKVGNVDFGKGIIYDVVLGRQPVSDLSETSSLLTIKKPALGQEVISIDNFKVIQLSLNEVLQRQSATGGDMVNSFLGYVRSVMDYTLNAHYYELVVGLINGWTPVQTKQTKSIEIADTSALAGDEARKAIKANTEKIFGEIRILSNNLQTPQNGYTDVATYTDPNDGTTKNIETCIDREDLVLYINDKYYTDYLKTASSLYHDEKLGGMLPNKVVPIPEASITSANSSCVGWLCYEKKFAVADFYRLTQSFFDGSTLYENLFLHFAYGAGTFEYAPGIKIMTTVSK